MSATAATLKANGSESAEDASVRNVVSPLRVHWAGIAVLVAINLMLLVRVGVLWHAASTHNADALAEQRLDRKAADAAAVPLRGVDAKVAASTAEADRFYRERLPAMQSQVVTEIGDLAKKNSVRLTRVAYTPAVVLAGTPDELTEEKIDASLSGDYRPLVQFINELERDRMFFVIDGVTLNGQQTGTVNLRLRLTTYLRGGAVAAEGPGVAGPGVAGPKMASPGASVPVAAAASVGGGR